MISLSDDAKSQLDNYFEGKEKSPLRVFLSGGCCGAHLALALDEPNDDDETFAAGGYTLLAAKELLAAAGEVSIGWNEYGFLVTSENALEGAGESCCSGGCGGGCGSEGCDC